MFEQQFKFLLRRYLPFAVVSIGDGWGWFKTPEDAANAGKKWIWVKAGTYPPTAIHEEGVFVFGTRSAIFDGGITAHGLTISGARCLVFGVQAKTTAGGGSEADGISITGERSIALCCYVQESDDVGIRVNGPGVKLISNEVTGADGDGVDMGNTADDCIFLGNDVYSNGGWGFDEGNGSENCIYVANRVTGNASGGINQRSGTGTYVGNDET